MSSFAAGSFGSSPSGFELLTRCDIAPAEDAVRSGQMKVPVKLLPDRVDKDRVFVSRKFIHPFRPERNGEADQQNGFDQHDRKFQMRRDAALHAFMIGHRMAALAKTQENINEKGRPADERARP